MSKKEVAKLNLVIEQLKASMCRIGRFISEHEDESMSDILRNQLETRRDILKTNFEKFQEVHIQLLYGTPEEDDRSEQFEKDYFDILTKINVKLSVCSRQVNVPYSSMISNSNSNISTAKLPHIDIPSSDGKNLNNFKPFLEIFTAVIDKNCSLSDVEKLFYLRSYLKGEAFTLVNTLPILNSSYAEALQILTNRYDNETMLINSHITSILEIPNMQNGNPVALREFISKVKQQVGALKNLKQPVHHWDMILICILSKKLDRFTNRSYQMDRDSSKLPTLNDFLQYLESRSTALEAAGNNEQKVSGKMHFSHLALENSKDEPKCLFCKVSGHKIYNCKRFKIVSVSDRISFIDKNKCCRICLNTHFGQCKLSIKCQTCAKDHNSLLHLDKSGGYRINIATNFDQNSFKVQYGPTENVLLPTIKAEVKGKNDRYVVARCLLDSGSQMSLISQRLVKQLNLTPFKNKLNIVGISENITQVQNSVFINIKSCLHDYTATVKCAVVEKISKIPQFEFNETKIPNSVQLSDSEYNQPKDIDVLLSADIFFQILLKDNLKLDSGLILQNTLFGYIVSGSIPLQASSQVPVSFHAIYKNIEQLVSQFWEVEKVPEIYTEYSTEQDACEAIFNNSIQKINNKFQVDLPLKLPLEDINLGDSFSIAYKRFENLEKRFKSNPLLFQHYKRFIDEYLDLNHAKVFDIEGYNFDTGKVYFMGHHPVIREDKKSTSFRVVFDGSMKSKNKNSINDFLYNGAVVQNSLFEILILFRTYKFVLLADIKKMYRMILINPEHTSLQNILWRDDPSLPIQCLQLQTVTYGLKSSAFQATRCLVYLANNEKKNFPLASQALLQNTYVDDILAGADTLQDAMKLKNELIDLLRLGSFELHKWGTNNISIINDIPREKCHLSEVDINKMDSTVKTLGLSYITNSDCFKITAPKVDNNNCITKRQVLSFISKFYDPLGLVGPILVKAKLFMQKIWSLKLKWDDILPDALLECWNQFISNLSNMPPIYVFRTFNFADADSIELVGYCDSSEIAYGAVLYIRVLSANEVFVNLICSKSRIVPLNKNLTIPRLELNSALLLGNLANTIYNLLKTKISKVVLYSDSNITLAWIKSNPINLNPYVGNRVKKIQDINNSFNWQYINTKENPADCLSRGLEPQQIHKNQLWFNGPKMLREQYFFHKNLPVITPNPLPEEKRIVILQTLVKPETFFTNFSNISRLTRIVAYLFRFCQNAKNKNSKISGKLSLSELNNSLKCIIKCEQSYSFSSEIERLKNNLPLKTPLSSLYPFLDHENVLRVGGRLHNANISYSQKHPIILPKNNHITELIIRKEHLNLLHAGQKQVLSSLNLEYWVINGIREVKRIIHKCVTCFKAKAKCSQQLMGSLPEGRVSKARPFQNVGIDFCGPFYIKQSRIRKSIVTKSYIALFVCFAVKAIHMELLSDLTTENFLAAFKRFIFRRGKPCNVYCDNGATFKGAKNKLAEFYVLNSNENRNKIDSFCCEERIQFKFIPSYSPVFGGLWEAGVKSAKYHIKRVVGNSQLSYEEFNTLIIQIEGILNSRPLTPMSNDPSDLSYLTPSHFLIGTPITSFPEPDYTRIPENRLKFWKLCNQMQQHFWHRWQKDYLAQLQCRPKWRSNVPNVKEGMLVLLKEENVPSLKWPMARIIKIIPGKDGKVRVAEVKTQNGSYLRSITKIAILPIQYEN